MESASTFPISNGFLSLFLPLAVFCITRTPVVEWIMQARLFVTTVCKRISNHGGTLVYKEDMVNGHDIVRYANMRRENRMICSGQKGKRMGRAGSHKAGFWVAKSGCLEQHYFLDKCIYCIYKQRFVEGSLRREKERQKYGTNEI